MLKTGIVSSAYFHFDDFATGLQVMKKDDYDCCDYHGFIHSNSPLYIYGEHELKLYLSNVLESAIVAGIKFNQLHAQWPLSCETDAEVAASIEIVKRSIRGATYLNCPNVVVHTFAPFGWNKEIDAKKTFDLNVRIFKELTAYARDFDITVCIENLPFVCLEISKVDTVLKLIRAVNQPNCKMCFDVGHAHVFHDDIAEDIKKIGSYLQVLHVHDNNGQFDSHLIPWQGSINWNEFVAAIRDINFSGCISLETYVDLDMPREVKTSMRKLLSQLARILATM